MIFSSIVFLFYFLPLFFVTFLVSGFSKHALLIFSLIFYAWSEPVFLPLILAMIVLNFWLGLAIEQGHVTGHARLWVTVGIIGNLIPLGIFKYGMFVVQMLLGVTGPLFARVGVSADQFIARDIPLPLGISFYTFHALSYLIDVYRKDVRAERNVRDLAVYISMFPQLIAGPIIRYKMIAGELHKPVLSAERGGLGVQFLVIGLAQKVLIANTVAASADAIFALLPINCRDRSHGWASSATRCKSISISAAIRTWPSALVS
jgi:alginate O-acetyltransferase complex protein AlgI